jgi:uncharacterized protein (TIGR02145 family)
MKWNKKTIITVVGGVVAVGVATFAVVTLAGSPVTDTYTDTSKIASHTNLTVDTTAGQVKLGLSTDFTCGGTWTDTRDSQTYTTKAFGAQCWMTQNMNVGTRVAGSATQGVDCSSATNIQKYCYSDTDSNCTTYGGLYQWSQAMCGSTTAGAQGICPVGWHVPTHDQYTTLERAVCTSGTCASDFPFDTSTTGYRGTNEGTSLKSGGASGFNALLAGYRNSTGSFSTLGSNTTFWSSLQSGSNAWNRDLSSASAQVGRSTIAKTYGFSVRCLKD